MPLLDVGGPNPPRPAAPRTVSASGSDLPAYRLNPFAFASDTTLRFILLIFTIVGVGSLLIGTFAKDVYADLGVPLPATLRDRSSILEQCMNAATDAHPGDLGQQGQSLVLCGLDVWRAERLFDAFHLMGLVVLAGVVVWLFPRWIDWRHRLEPIDPDELPEVGEYLADLCDVAGIDRRIRFVWRPHTVHREADAFTFGTWGRYCVALNAPLVMLFYTNRATFRAVVLHELAHVRNRDIDLAYWTIALGLVFAAVVATPSMLYSLYEMVSEMFRAVSAWKPEEQPDMVLHIRGSLHLGWRLGVFAALYAFLATSVIRTRELYADVRASTFDDTYRQFTEQLQQNRPARGNWQSVFAWHPSWSVRHTAVRDTRLLFHVHFWDAFATGLAATVAISVVAQYYNDIVPPSQMPAGFQGQLMKQVLYGFPFAPLAIAIVGVGVWRSAFAALLQSRKPDRPDRAAIGLGLGMVAGFPLAVSFLALYDVPPALTVTGVATWLTYHVTWSVMTVVGLVVLMRWVALSARFWADRSAKDRSPWRAFAITTGSVVVLATLWVGDLTRTRQGSDVHLAAESLEQAISAAKGLMDNVLLLAGWPQSVIAVALLWGGLFLARARTGGPATMSWAFLDAPAEAPWKTRATVLHVRRVVAPVVAGIAAFAVYLAGVYALEVAAPDLNRVLADWSITQGFGRPIAGALIQAVVAVFVARRSRDEPWLHGMFAAFVVGLAMAAFLTAHAFALGRIGTVQQFSMATLLVENLGAIFSLLALAVFARHAPQRHDHEPVTVDRAAAEDVAPPTV